MKKPIIVLGLLFVLTMAYQNCGQPGQLMMTPSANNDWQITNCTGNDCQTQENIKISMVPQGPYICEPFGGGGNTGSASGGLKAQLSYMDLSKVTSNRNDFLVKQYFNASDNRFVQTPVPLYFKQINTPTRVFDQGFQLDSGGFLENMAGEKLIEYFAINYKTQLKLSANQTPGYYQFATISDDGIIVEYNENNTVKTLINADGMHSSMMKCTDNAIAMTANQKLPLDIYYYQGPRVRIANVFLWRKVETAVAPSDEECNRAGDEYFWDTSNGSAKQPFQNLLSRGWQVIDSENFELQNNETNPCHVINEDIIGNVQFSSQQTANGVNITAQYQSSMAGIAEFQLFKMVNGSAQHLFTYAENQTSQQHLTNLVDLIKKDTEYKLVVLLKIPSSNILGKKEYKITIGN